MSNTHIGVPYMAYKDVLQDNTLYLISNYHIVVTIGGVIH